MEGFLEQKVRDVTRSLKLCISPETI